MKNNLTFVNTINSVLTKLKSQLGKGADNSRYTIFKSIPHRRVVSKNVSSEEIFDLYQLGIFAAPSACQQGHEIQENIELVELKSKATYRPHYHKDSTAVIYIVSGSGTFLLGDSCIGYQAGKRIVIPAGFLHGFNTDTPTLFLSIQSPPIINSVTGQIDLHYHNEEQA